MYAARYRHLTTRDTNRLTLEQAQTAVAGAILHTQGVRAIGFDPELEAMLSKVAVDIDALKTRDRG